MNALVERIRREGRVLPGGLLKVDRFLNHRLDPALTLAMGRAFRERFDAADTGPVDLVLTAESSGIAPALATALAYDVPLVFARKKRPATMPDRVLEAHAPSRTKGGHTPLIVSPEMLPPGQRVLLIDDFLASGLTIAALAGLIEASGSALRGIGVVIEKTFQDGRDVVEPLNVPVLALAAIDAMDEVSGRITVRPG